MTQRTIAGRLVKDLDENGFSTKPVPQELRSSMFSHIEEYIKEIGAPYLYSQNLTERGIKAASLEEIAAAIPDEVWAVKMSRAFRIFPMNISKKIYEWADGALRSELGRERSAVNVVYPQEVETNPKLKIEHFAIYWRCVRPGKPDAGRPHRDASFWDLEFKEGYDPKIPFSFNYLKDCIKIWMPITGCIPTTTLQIIPRSHKMEIPTIVEATEYGRRPTIDQAWLEKNERNFSSPIELSQGSCIIFDMNLVHRGPKHNNSELRISAELNFIVQ